MQRKPRAASARTMANSKLLKCGSSLLHSLRVCHLRSRTHLRLCRCIIALLTPNFIFTLSVSMQQLALSKHGTCVSRYEKNSYVCLCAKGFSGEYCQSLSKKVFYSYHIIEKVNIKRNSSHS